MAKKLERVFTSLAALMLLTGSLMFTAQSHVAADGGGPLPPTPICNVPSPGLRQVAFPPGQVEPVLPAGQKHQLTTEYANQGFVFSDNDSDMTAQYKKFNQAPMSYNLVRQGTLGEVYRINFSGDDVREATVVMRVPNVNPGQYKLTGFGANGNVLDTTVYSTFMNPNPSWYFQTLESSTPIKSIVFTQTLGVNNLPTTDNTMTCLTYGTRTPSQPPAPPVTPPITPPAIRSNTIYAPSTADAWFEQGSIGSNKGDDSTLKVQSKNGDAKRSAVGFTLPAIPAGCALDTAQLHMYADGYSSGRTLVVQSFGSAWTESEINWENQPSVAGSAATAGSASYKDWVIWQVTTQVQNWYANASSNHGFLVRDTVETADAEQSFNAREKGQSMPILALKLKPSTTTPPVEPTPPTPPVSCTSKFEFATTDAWFEQGSPDSNKGSDSSLKVQSKSGNDAKRATVNFVLPATPAGCTIDNATLRLYADSVKSGRTIAVQGLTNTWGEADITWANQPVGSGPVATAQSGSTKGWKTWNVTAIVNSSSSFSGFVVRDAVEDQDAEQVYNFREKGQNAPTLVITYRPL